MTAIATQNDQNQLFGSTRDEVVENLLKIGLAGVSAKVLRKDFIDRTCRQTCVKSMSDALIQANSLVQRYCTVKQAFSQFASARQETHCEGDKRKKR